MSNILISKDFKSGKPKSTQKFTPSIKITPGTGRIVIDTKYRSGKSVAKK
jgi:hypothetical protein